MLASAELTVARDAARAAGEVLENLFRRTISVQGKDPDARFNLVSAADLEAERAIVQVIRNNFPTHAIHGEELHRDPFESNDLWVIDPLDGTNNFVHGIPHFAVSIAYCCAGQPRCGVVFNPARRDWFEAVRGQGAWHNGQAVRVAASQSLDEVLIGVGFYYDRGAMMEATLDALRDLFRCQIHGMRRFGTAALDLSHVACGYYGGYFEYLLSPWDFAAGWLIVEEAGGTVSDCQGQPLVLRKTGVLATNAHLHPAMLEIVRAHLP
jgi:myo-inositol-1(or 4)-monophosphatase